MNGKLILGVVLMIVGIAAAIVGIMGVGKRDVRATLPPQIVENAQESFDGSSSIAWPLFSGLSLAVGGALVGIGMGRFRRPKIVRPDSPQATEAATTTGVVEDEAGISARAYMDDRRRALR